MSITLHETGGTDEYRNVLTRVNRALKPGGTLLVAELPYPDSPEAYRTKPAYRMLAGVQLHESLVGCDGVDSAEIDRDPSPGEHGAPFGNTDEQQGEPAQQHVGADAWFDPVEHWSQLEGRFEVAESPFGFEEVLVAERNVLGGQVWIGR